MTGDVRNLFGGDTSESPDDINQDMAVTFRELAERAERGEISGMFCVIMTPALSVDRKWLGHMGTGLSLRGAIAAALVDYDSNEL